MKQFTGQEIPKAPDGAYQIFWKDGCQRKYCSKIHSIIVFFGTQFCYDLSKGVPGEIEKIVLLMEGV